MALEIGRGEKNVRDNSSAASSAWRALLARKDTSGNKEHERVLGPST